MGQSFITKEVTVRTQTSLYECILYTHRLTIIHNEIQRLIINLIKLLFMKNVTYNYEDLSISHANLLSTGDDINNPINVYVLRDTINPYGKNIFIVFPKRNNILIISKCYAFDKYKGMKSLPMDVFMNETCKDKKIFVIDLLNFTLCNGGIVSDLSKTREEFLFICSKIFDSNIVPLRTIDNNGYPRLAIIINNSSIFDKFACTIKYIV